VRAGVVGAALLLVAAAGGFAAAAKKAKLAAAPAPTFEQRLAESERLMREWMRRCAKLDDKACKRELEHACAADGDSYACRRTGEDAYNREEWDAAIKLLQRACKLGDECACGEAREAPGHDVFHGGTICS
jgi:hypothetical protein